MPRRMRLPWSWELILHAQSSCSPNTRSARHPEAAAQEIAACLDALNKAQTELGAQIVMTYPNGDIGSEVIISALNAFASDRDDVVLRQSLGRRLYHGLLSVCGWGQGVCVGNSSSGLKETPAFHCPAVDIGTRQNGRLRGANVLNVPCEAGPIFEAIQKSLEDHNYRKAIKTSENPYGQGNAGPMIAQILTDLDLKNKALLPKLTVF